MSQSENPHERAAEAVNEGRPVEAQYARQGRSGVRILLLLVVSVAAVAVLLLGMWLLSQGGFSNTNANIGDQAVDAQAYAGDAQSAPTADAATGPTGQAQQVPTGEAPNLNAPTTPSN